MLPSARKGFIQEVLGALKNWDLFGTFFQGVPLNAKSHTNHEKVTFFFNEKLTINT